MIQIDWRKIRPHKTSQRLGFEELVCQLAFQEIPANGDKFIRVEAPDGGVECYWILANSYEIGWQAKYFVDNFGSPQWKQIENSLLRALETHPKLIEYYIAVPVDFEDPRIPNKQSIKDKWDEHVAKWEAIALTKNIKLRVHLWGSFELTARLINEENAGRRYYWFSDAELSEKWFKDRLEIAIADLDKRYSPKLNIELDISKSLIGIYGGKFFKDTFDEICHIFFVEFQGAFKRLDDEFSLNKKTLYIIIKKINDVFFEQNIDSIKKINTERWTTLLRDITNECNELTAKMDELDKLDKETKINKGLIKKDDDYYKYQTHLFGYEKSQISKFARITRDLLDFIASDCLSGFNNPFILLKGEKGTGKSHLLADIAKKQETFNNSSILLLGQHFTEDNPWYQIIKKVGFQGSVDEFLGALNSKAESQKSRIVIIVDAINEGAGIQLWTENIRGFIVQIKKYPSIGLILSIRTPYEKMIFDEDYIANNLIEIIHIGFDEKEYEASKFFFKEYGIEQPKIPLLYPEFRNPLFLKLFCDGLKKANKTVIPKEGYEGISEIMGFLTRATNKILAKPNRLKYSSSLNIVDQALELFINKLIEKGKSALQYEEAHILLEDGLKPFNIKSGILEELINEGLLAKTLFWEQGNYIEAVYFTYQRYEDHFKAKCLINRYYSISKSKSAFNKTGGIGKLFKDNEIAFRNIRTLEALAIQIPEMTGYELFEVFSHIKNYGFFVRCMIDSLHWRKAETIEGDKMLKYFKLVLNDDCFKVFLNTILQTSGKPGHYFNGDFLHKWLLSFSMADRDSIWTPYINEHFKYTYSVKRLIDWAWNDENKDHIEYDSILLIGTTISWFLTASNRNLRDAGTKSITAIFKNRLLLLLQLLNKFENVNDIGVIERLYAASYGAVLISANLEGLSELAKYIYEQIFDKEFVIPHLLLRDYARNIIEFAAYKIKLDNINLEKIKPPYKSEWYCSIPTIKEINKMEYDYKAKDFKDYYWSQNSVINSVIGISADFDKDGLDNIIRNWKVNSGEIRRIIIKRAFDFGYDVEKHGKYDRRSNDYRSENQKIETIGKKYTWQALYEVAAKVSDNKEYLKKHFQPNYGNYDMYNGPWEPFIRDFDPTLLITKTCVERYKTITKNWWFNLEYDNWNIPDKKWVRQKVDLPSIENVIQVSDLNKKEWIVLDTDLNWESPIPFGEDKYESERKTLRISAEAFLLPSNKRDEIDNYFSKGNGLNNTHSNRNGVWNLFNREFYWSPGYNDIYKDPHYNGVEINDNVFCFYACDYFLWENGHDYSKESRINFTKPAKILFDGLKLNYGDVEGTWTNNRGGVICFDPSVNSPSNPCLIVGKIELMQFLKENRMDLIWIIVGEKILLGNHRDYKNKYWGRATYRGIYCLENGLIKGRLFTSFEERD